MADKNIQMTQRNADNTGWDSLFPKTKGANVVAADGVTTFESHLADNATDAHNAGNISVADTAGHFTGDDVEEVLAELFTFANDGKTDIADAVTAMGVSASPSDTFATLATKIGQINTGKKYASGSVTSATSALNFILDDGTSSSQYYITVTGLTFTPSLIELYYNTNYDRTFYSSNGQFGSGGSKIAEDIKNSYTPQYFKLTGNAYVNNTGFQMPVMVKGVSYIWRAYE